MHILMGSMLVPPLNRPHPRSCRYARKAAEEAGVADKLQLIAGKAEALPLEDGSVDAVVMTHVSWQGWEQLGVSRLGV